MKRLTQILIINFKNNDVKHKSTVPTVTVSGRERILFTNILTNISHHYIT